MKCKPSPSFRLFPRVTIAVLFVSVLAACTNISNDANRTRTEGAMAGAAGGALLGAGAGALAGKGKTKGMAQGAALGTLAGGAAGAAYGNSVARKKGEYTQTEDTLDARLASIQQETANRKQYTTQLRQKVAVRQAQLQTVLGKSDPNGPTAVEFDLRSSLAVVLNEVTQKARSWQDTISEHKAALQKMTEDARSAALQNGIDGLSVERGELLKSREQLLSIAEQLKR